MAAETTGGAMNVKLLRKVAKHIDKEPKRLSMGNWVDKKTYDGEKVWDSYSANCSEHGYAACGTAACIGGWTELLTYNDEPKPLSSDVRAAQLLGIDEEQAQRLFFPESWPEKFEARYANAKTPRGKATVAIARIEHFIKTKGKE